MLYFFIIAGDQSITFPLNSWNFHHSSRVQAGVSETRYQALVSVSYGQCQGLRSQIHRKMQVNRERWMGNTSSDNAISIFTDSRCLVSHSRAGIVNTEARLFRIRWCLWSYLSIISTGGCLHSCDPASEASHTTICKEVDFN